MIECLETVPYDGNIGSFDLYLGQLFWLDLESILFRIPSPHITS